MNLEFYLSRHAVLMTKAPGVLMNQIKEINNPGLVYTQCMDIIVRLAEHGLIHCDFNEFNLIVDKKGKVTLIDFPQMVSTNHPSTFKFDYHFNFHSALGGYCRQLELLSLTPLRRTPAL